MAGPRKKVQNQGDNPADPGLSRKAKTMFRKILTVLCLSAVSLSVPAVALAESGTAHEAGAKDGKEKRKFPIEGAEFRKHVNERIEKVKAKVEKHISEKKVSEEKAKKIREHLADGIAKVNKATDKAVEDGKVTKDEAKEVHKAFRSMHPRGEHAKKHHDKKDKLAPGRAPKLHVGLVGRVDPRGPRSFRGPASAEREELAQAVDRSRELEHAGIATAATAPSPPRFAAPEVELSHVPGPHRVETGLGDGSSEGGFERGFRHADAS